MSINNLAIIDLLIAGPNTVAALATQRLQVPSMLKSTKRDRGRPHHNRVGEGQGWFTGLAQALVRVGRIEEARAIMRRLLPIAPGTSLAMLSERLLLGNILDTNRVLTDLHTVNLSDLGPHVHFWP